VIPLFPFLVMTLAAMTLAAIFFAIALILVCGQRDNMRADLDEAKQRNRLDNVIRATQCKEIQRLRNSLKTIQEWDCLNPPQRDLCHDLPWLRQVVDDALK
jgi:hypothetical protein